MNTQTSTSSTSQSPKQTPRHCPSPDDRLSPRAASSCRSSPNRSPLASCSEELSPGPTDVARSSLCYQRHKAVSPASSNFLSPVSQISQVFSRSAEHICEKQQAASRQSSSNSLAPASASCNTATSCFCYHGNSVPKRITFSGSLTPTSFSPEHDHDLAVKRAGSGRRAGALLKRVSGSIRRSQSANNHKEVPKAALKLREKAETLRAESTQLDNDGLRNEEEHAATFDDDAAMDFYLNDKSKKKTSIAGVFQNWISLRKATPDSPDARLDKLLKQQKPALDTLLLWGRSLDALLNDKYGLQLFRGFLRTEFSDENIEFWIACENYKSIPERKLSARAQKIYDYFIAVQAPREVNLDSKTRLHTMAAMTSPTPFTFEQAQRRIQSLMEKDSYQRFLRSELYCNLLRQARESKEDKQHPQTKTIPVNSL